MEVRIGMIGLGTVGSGVLELLDRHRGFFRRELGFDFVLAGLCSRSQARLDRFAGRAPFLTRDPLALASHPGIDVLVEVAGGEEHPRAWVEAALKSGKHVVTANKALLARHGKDLFPLAEKQGRFLLFEAAVGGGIPIIRTLQESFVANDIHGLACIINGTCNYILTRMANEGKPYEEIIVEAKKLGYAEADESLDVDGIDTAHKAAILASLSYGFWVKMEDIHIEGIRTISALDISYARQLGYTIKLLAIIKPDENNAAQVRVHPTLIPSDSVLASVSGVYNAVAVEGDVVGKTLYYGRGAGADATASAVLCDVAEAAADLGINKSSRFTSHDIYGKVAKIDQVETRYYVRFSALDQPGVLAQVATIFGKHGIGISSVYQPEEHSGETVPLLMVLDKAKEAKFQDAYREIKQLAVIKEPCQAIRVEDFS